MHLLRLFKIVYVSLRFGLDEFSSAMPGCADCAC